ncbi:MAG TPA: TRAM domain-containing protein [Nitriliruptorales bacterium]
MSATPDDGPDPVEVQIDGSAQSGEGVGRLPDGKAVVVGGTIPGERVQVQVQIDGFAHGGEGVGRLPDGKAVFVAGAIPGERVQVRIDEQRKRWARGAAVAILEASPHRITPPCPYVPECGGCDLQHVDPDHQRVLKTRVVREQLQRLGRIDDPPVADCRAVGPDTRYRTSARFHADRQGRLGFHRAGTHDVVPIDDCLVLSERPQALRRAVGDATGAAQVTVRGRARPDEPGVVVLEPGAGPLDVPDGDFDVAVVQRTAGTTSAPGEGDLDEAVVQRSAGTTSPAGEGDLGEVLPLRGDGVLTAEVAGFTYRFDAGCFFQVNTGGAQAIVDEVLAAAGPVDGLHVWDLYAGVGLLSLPLARAGGIVTAVEAHEASAQWCARNADEYELDILVVSVRTERLLRVARAGELLGGSDGVELDQPDVVVLDPPRKGAGQDTVRDIAALAPARIVYVACDPAALARDARVLTDHGYHLQHVVPLDLFPMTHHVEAVATFHRV